jgi:seryl-tRNA synthetase
VTAIPHEALATTLVDAGFLIETSADGVYGHGAGFAMVADAVAGTVRRLTADGAEHMRFASVMPRSALEQIGYFRNFPHLLGTVHCFCGSEAEHRQLIRKHDAGEDWLGGQVASELVLIPAACYPVYGILARRGAVPHQGHTVQVEANCFRHEPSKDPIRLQSFHMHEIVRVGAEQDVLAFRDGWLDKAPAIFAEWGLQGSVDPADDPFFGRTAVVMAKSQRMNELKFEWRIAISDREKPTACLSANYHLDSFGKAVGLSLPDGGPAHSACVGFGIERITLALLRQHGTDLADWPIDVARALGFPRPAWEAAKAALNVCNLEPAA